VFRNDKLYEVSRFCMALKSFVKGKHLVGKCLRLLGTLVHKNSLLRCSAPCYMSRIWSSFMETRPRWICIRQFLNRRVSRGLRQVRGYSRFLSVMSPLAGKAGHPASRTKATSASYTRDLNDVLNDILELKRSQVSKRGNGSEPTMDPIGLFVSRLAVLPISRSRRARCPY
jgi:hypothetical protein